MFTWTPSDAGAIADYGSRPIMRTLSNVGRTIKLSGRLSGKNAIVSSGIVSETSHLACLEPRDSRIEISVSVTITKASRILYPGPPGCEAFECFVGGAFPRSRGHDFCRKGMSDVWCIGVSCRGNSYWFSSKMFRSNWFINWIKNWVTNFYAASKFSC